MRAGHQFYRVTRRSAAMGLVSMTRMVTSHASATCAAPAQALGDSRRPRRSGFTALLYVILGAMTCALLLVLTLTKHLDHDENQFVASGAVLARSGLLPYRDYPYFHAPYLVGIYALLFTRCHYLLLAARLLMAFFGFLTAALVFKTALRLMSGHSNMARLTVAISAGAILVFGPLFILTSGRAWNHDLPTLLTLIAFLLLKAGERGLTPGRSLLAGFCAATSVGVRLTFGPAAIALAAIAWFASERQHRRRNVALYFAAAAVAALPFIWLFSLAPSQCIFDNLQYTRINTVLRASQGHFNGMGVLGRIRFVFTDVLAQPANAFVFLGAAVSLVAAWRSADHPRRRAVLSLALLIGALLIGTFAPSPSFYPYFYTPWVFCLLLILYAAPTAEKAQIQWARTIMAGAVVCIIFGIPRYRGITDVVHFTAWLPVKVHRAGVEVARVANGRPVLTLEPIFPLEGGASIYPQLVTGPFAFRVEPLLTEAQEKTMNTVGPDDLQELLQAKPAGALLYGWERRLEQNIAALAADRPKTTLRISRNKKLTLVAGPIPTR